MESIDDFSVIDELVIEEEPDSIQEEIVSTQKAIQNANSKMKEIMNMFMVNAIDHNQLTYMTSELKKVIKVNEDKLKELQQKHQSHPVINKNNIAKSILEHWSYLTDSEKLAFLTDFVEEIVIVNRSTDRHNGEAEVINVKFYS